MEDSIPTKRIWYYLTILWVLVGLITHLSSIFWMMQYREEISLYVIFDVGFYYYIPVFLWIIYTPVIIQLYKRWPLTLAHWKQSFLPHLLISISFAPLARIIAIFLDYSIKNLVGMVSTPAWEMVYQARFIVVGSTPRAFLNYWAVIGAVIGWKYFFIHQKKEADQQSTPRTRDRIVVPHNSGKKIIEVQDIMWIEANGNYINLYTTEHRFRLRKSLVSFRDELDVQQFYQIHRSRIVNKAAIESLAHWRRGEYLIRLKNDKLLSSSRTYRQNIQEILSELQR